MIVEAWRVQQGMGKACRLETQKELQLEFEGTLSDQEELMLQMKSKGSLFPLSWGGKSFVLSSPSVDGIRHPHYGNQSDLL